ncbi:MAG: hypothetical protein OSB03_15715, partial [Vicinamibacterales bacterium]|nr:hypothetical protein [Vicinamibacterales bacterium]
PLCAGIAGLERSLALSVVEVSATRREPGAELQRRVCKTLEEALAHEGTALVEMITDADLI